MFAVNDYVIYGGNGVCRVKDICTPKISGIDKDALYYVISTVGYSNGTTIYVRVDNTKITMRKISTKEEAEKIIDSIPLIKTIWSSDEKTRENNFMRAVKSSDCQDWIKIIKTMYEMNRDRTNQTRTKSHIGEVYVKAAREHLLGEFSISLGMPKAEVDLYITNRVKAQDSTRAV